MSWSALISDRLDITIFHYLKNLLSVTTGFDAHICILHVNWILTIVALSENLALVLNI